MAWPQPSLLIGLTAFSSPTKPSVSVASGRPVSPTYGTLFSYYSQPITLVVANGVATGGESPLPTRIVGADGADMHWEGRGGLRGWRPSRTTCDFTDRIERVVLSSCRFFDAVLKNATSVGSRYRNPYDHRRRVSLSSRRVWCARGDSNPRPLAPEGKIHAAKPSSVSYLALLPREAATRIRGFGLKVNAFCTASASRGSTVTCV